MKPYSVFLMAFLALVLSALPCAAAPVAEPVKPVFEFSPLVEGQKISHTFVIRNTGDTVLNILDVLPP
jgi:hypothetical protein